MQTSNSTPYGYIYKITNSINGKCYIGQTTNSTEFRWKKYKRFDCAEQPKIYHALKKYGQETFTYETLDVATNQEELNFLEEIYMLCFDSRENGYNIKEGGSHGKHSEETKQKISIANRGRKQTEEHRFKLSLSHRSKRNPLSEETKLKISHSKRGYKFSEEHLKNMSISRMGKSHPHKGHIKQ